MDGHCMCGSFLAIISMPSQKMHRKRHTTFAQSEYETPCAMVIERADWTVPDFFGSDPTYALHNVGSPEPVKEPG